MHNTQHSCGCAKLSTRQSNICMQFKQRFPTIEKVFACHGADKWDYVLDHLVAAINAPTPTLAQLDAIYGTTGAGKALFINQLTAYYTMVERSGKPMNQQAADLAARQFIGRYGKQCTTAMLLVYFANYTEFKASLRDFDAEDIVMQFGRKFLKWWGDKMSQYYTPNDYEKKDENRPHGTEGLIHAVAQWLRSGETERDIKNPEKHPLSGLFVITDEIIKKAKEIALKPPETT